MQSSAPIRGVTVDGFGTLVGLEDPVPRLRSALLGVGVNASPEAAAAAFRAEVSHYRPRSHEAGDETSLVTLQHECVAVFLDELGAPVDPSSFVDAFMGALEFDLLPGTRDALVELQRLGLKLACVANWDIGLHAELERLGVSELFDAIVTSGDVGVPKPAPAIFEHALRAIAVESGSAVHIGDEEADRQGALAAGMRFEPVPLVTLPVRIGRLLAL